MNESTSQTDVALSKLARWIAIATGLVTAGFGFVSSSRPFLIVPISLVLGAAVQPYSPRQGRRVIWVSSILLSIGLLPLVPVLFRESGTASGSYRDFNYMGMLLLLWLSPLLVATCDIVLVVDALTRGRGQSTSTHGTAPNKEWLSWIVALFLSFWLLPDSVRALAFYHRNGGLDTLLSAASIASVILVFDVLITASAVKALRAHRLDRLEPN
jgi:hypothetical protein